MSDDGVPGVRKGTSVEIQINGAIWDAEWARHSVADAIESALERQEIARRVLRPERPRLAEALAAVTGLGAIEWRGHVAGGGCRARRDGMQLGPNPSAWVPWTTDDPREAWESLASFGLIGYGDADSAARRFTCDCDGGRVSTVFEFDGTAQRAQEIVWTLVELNARRDSNDEYAVSAHPRELEALRASQDVMSKGIVRRDGTVAYYGLRIRPSSRLAGGTLRLIGAAEYLRHDRCEGRGTLPYPAAVADCVAFASDWPNVLRAEELAREFFRRNPWVIPPKPANVVWCTLDAATVAARRRAMDLPYALVFSEAERPGLEVIALGYVVGSPRDTIVLEAPSLGA